MEIISLRTFKSVVDERGIRGASERLNTVQSNITTRIHKLENELDAKLFTLMGRKLELTPTGELLYDYAAQILRLEHQATSAVLRSKGCYELRIGTAETFAAVHLPLILKQLKRIHPEIGPRVTTTTSAEMTTAVLNNQIECATIGNATSHVALNAIPIVNEELVLVTPLDGGYESVLFVRQEGCAYRSCALAWQQEAGRSGEEMMVMSSADGVLGCIAAGLGYTVIGKDNVIGSRYEKALSTESITHGQTHMEISMVYRQDSPVADGILNLSGLFK